MCVDFSPDGRLIAAGDSQGYLYVAEVATGHCHLLNQQVDGIDAVAFLPGGPALVATDRGGAIAAWRVPSTLDLERWEVERTAQRWKAHEGRAGAIEPVNGGETLISGGRDGVMRVWKTVSRSVRWSPSRVSRGNEFVVSPKDRLYVTGIEISVWDLRKRQLVETMARADLVWESLAISATGTFLAAAQHGRLILIDLASGQIIEEWPLDDDWEPWWIAVAPDGNTVAFSDYAFHEEIFLYQRGQDGPSLRLSARQCDCLRFSPDGRWLATNDGNDLRLFDLESGGETRTLPAHSRGFSGLAFSSDGSILATVGSDRLLKLWQMPDCQQVFSIVAHDDAIEAVAISPDACTVATAGDDQRVKLWRAATGQPLGELGHEPSAFRQLDFDQNGRRLVGRLRNGVIVVYDGTESTIWDEDTLQSLRSDGFTNVPRQFQGLGDLPGGQFWSRADAVSSDGRFVAGFSRVEGGRQAFLWSVESGLTSFSLTNGSSLASGVSDDGCRVCGGGPNGAHAWSSPQDSETIIGAAEAEDLSADGSVIIGRRWNKRRWQAFRWESGDTEILSPSPSHTHSQAVATTPDGELVLGRVFNTKGVSGREQLSESHGIRDSRPVLWGKSGIRFLRGFDRDANWWPTDISSDGSVVVGMRWPQGKQWNRSTGDRRAKAFRWEDGSVTLLGDLSPSLNSIAMGVSGDGRLIVGSTVRGDDHVDEIAFLWDRHTGIRSLQNALAETGIVTPGWKLAWARAISGDGTTVVGIGQNANDQHEAWRVRLPQNLTDSLHGRPASRPQSSKRDSQDTTADFALLGFHASKCEISQDGMRVVGDINIDNHWHSFRWARDEGLIMLPLPDGCQGSQKTIIDEHDGRIVARAVPKSRGVVCWTRRTRAPTVIEPPPDWKGLYSNGAAGGVVVGYGIRADEPGQFAWRYDQSGCQRLPRPDGVSHAGARRVSSDGAVVIGTGWSGRSTLQSDKSVGAKVLRWQNGKVEEFPGFTEGYVWQTTDISGDAGVIVGKCWREGEDPRSWRHGQAFRWQAGQVQLFEQFPSDAPYSAADAVSADGRVIVGSCLDDKDQTAFIWDEGHGRRRLDNLARSCGADLGGWHLASAQSISADGCAIVGIAQHEQGAKEVFLLRLPPSAFDTKPDKSESEEVANSRIP